MSLGSAKARGDRNHSSLERGQSDISEGGKYLSAIGLPSTAASGKGKCGWFLRGNDKEGSAAAAAAQGGHLLLARAA
jgi:hypothetical protein